MKMRLNSIKLPHYKHSHETATVSVAMPERVLIPMSQHMGAPCNPVVAVGDLVKAGQLIGSSDAFMSAPIHASIAGKVTAIVDFLLISGRTCKAVEITAGENPAELFEGLCPPKVTDKDSFLAAVRESGAVGLGGAGFPTHVKLRFDKDKQPVDTLVVNGAECEPYITSDYREFMEAPDDIIGGIKAVLSYLGIRGAALGIEENKPAAIALMKEKTAAMPEITVVPLKSTYPQGAEKVLIHSATGRIVGEGELPLHQGVVVMNSSTLGFLHRYLRTGIPLISRRITVAGDVIPAPMNLTVPLGTPISHVLQFAKMQGEPKKVLMGGPMMGLCIDDLNAPIVKNNNAILAFNELPQKHTSACIRCGRCAFVCPVRLMPVSIERAYERKDTDTLEALKVTLCMNCGSCSYTCPAGRSLAEMNQLAKQMLVEAANAKAQKEKPKAQ